MISIKILSIDLSNYCSKQCSFCYNNSNLLGSVKWGKEEVIAFASDCISNGIEAISLGGGEPFEYYGIFDIIKDLYPICYLSITSNGLPLEDPIIWEQLEKNKPDKIHLSLHNPHNPQELQRIKEQLIRIKSIGIKPG